MSAQGLPPIKTTVAPSITTTKGIGITTTKTTIKSTAKITSVTTKQMRNRRSLQPRASYTYVYLDTLISTNASDNVNAFNRALASCPKIGCFVTFKTSQAGKVYRFNNPTAVYVRDKVDFVLDGMGAQFLFSRLKVPNPNFNDGSCQPKPWKDARPRGTTPAASYSNGFMAVDTCQRCVLRNFIIDWDWNTARLGDIVQAQVGCTNRTWVLKFLTGSETQLSGGSIRSLHAINPATCGVGHVCADEFFPKNAPVIKKHPLLPATWIVNWPVDIPGRKFKTAPQEGTYYLVKRFIYDIHGVIVKRCQNCRFQSMDIWSVPGKAFTVSEDSHDMEFFSVNIVKPRSMSNLGIRVQDIKRDYRPITVTADALFFENVGGKVIIKDSEISWHGDDAVNIHDNMAAGDLGIQDLGNKRYQWAGSRFLSFPPGDSVEVLLPDFTSTKFTAKILASQSDSCGGWQVTLDKQILLPGRSAQESKTMLRNLTLVNARYSSSKLIIDGIKVHHHRGRGALVQSPDVVVQNSQFYDEQQPPIIVRVDATWKQLEGRASWNVLIFNNTFARSDANGYYDALVTVLARYQNDTVIWKVGGALNSPVVNGVTQSTFRGISIVGNRFIDTPNGAIHVSSTSDALIFGNTIINNQVLKSDANVTIGNPANWGFTCGALTQRGNIMVRGSTNVLVKGNEWSGSVIGSKTGLQYAANMIETNRFTRNVIVTPDNVLV